MSAHAADDLLRVASGDLQDASAAVRELLENYPLSTESANKLTVIHRGIVQLTADVLLLIPLQ